MTFFDRYGTQSSMVVHSSMCNPWFYPFFGTVAMAVGQIFGPELYPVMSNAGILIFVIALLALMAEVDKDMIATHNVASFLMQVGKMGDRISVTARPRAVPSVRQAYMDKPNSITTFRPFARQSLKNEESNIDVSDDGKSNSNANKSAHSVSTDITEPTSNVKKAISNVTKRKSAITGGSSVRSSLSVEEAQLPETIHEDADTPEVEQSESLGNQETAVLDKSAEVQVDSTSDATKETPLSSKTIMKGMLDDVQVLIDEELGEVQLSSEDLEVQNAESSEARGENITVPEVKAELDDSTP
jgi:hypothetical protein